MQLLGLNLRSDMVLTSEMKFGGERMDHYSHQPLPSEREAMLLKKLHARVPDHLRSSTHVKMEPRSGEGEAPATRAAGSRKPASKQRATQELLLQDAGGQCAHPLCCIALYTSRGMKSVQERCTTLYIICIGEGCTDRLRMTAL